MKLRISLLTILSLCALMTFAASKPQEDWTIYENLTYTIDHRTKTAVVDVNPKMSGDVYIPEEIEVGEDWYTVIGIGDKAFKGGKGITSFTLPSTIRFVYRSAFVDTEWYNNKENWGEKGTLYIDSILISVDPDSTKSKYYIPERTKIIAVGALLDCCKEKVGQVWVPATVKEIAPETFKNCKSLRKFHLGTGIQRIGKDAFKGTAAYENEGNWKKGVLYLDTCLIEANKDIKPNYVVRPESRVMADGAFKDNKVLRKITLSPRYKQIGNEVFCGCAQLEHVDMPETIEKIGDLAFTDCQRLKKIELPAGLKSIGKQCFSGCVQLEKISLPKAIKHIPEAAFYRCIALGEVEEWPAKLQTIGSGAFRDCSQLLEVKGLPLTLTKVGEGAFAGCAHLKSVVLPDSVTKISEHLFDGCRELRKATISDNTYDIDNYAFNGCIVMETFNMPTYMFRIGEYAFLNCSSLRGTRLVDRIERIEEGAFMNCASLEHLDLPLRLKYVDKLVFAGCKSLQEVNFHTLFETIEAQAFENCTLLKKVVLPEGCEVDKDAFKGCKTKIEYR